MNDLNASSQLIFFLFAILLGMALGFVFDLLRVSYSFLKKKRKLAAFFQDILFFFTAAAISYMYLIVATSGEIRFHILAGEFCGFVLYRVTISFFVFRGLRFFVKSIFGIIKIALIPIIQALRFVCRFAASLWRKAGFAGKTKNIFKKLLQKQQMMLYNKLNKNNRKGVSAENGEKENQISLVEEYFN